MTIVSGGQTGVDRAALDVALEAGLPCRGWCPAGRWAEDGAIDARYPLTETPSADPARRTRRNVSDADATLIICAGPLTGGTALTQRCAARLDRPCLVVDPGDPAAAAAIGAWIIAHQVRTLNVAGPRESHRPGTYEQAMALLRRVVEGTK